MENTHFSHWVATGTHTAEDGLCAQAVLNGADVKWTRANCDENKAEVYICEREQANFETGKDRTKYNILFFINNCKCWKFSATA